MGPTFLENPANFLEYGETEGHAVQGAAGEVKSAQIATCLLK